MHLPVPRAHGGVAADEPALLHRQVPASGVAQGQQARGASEGQHAGKGQRARKGKRRPARPGRAPRRTAHRGTAAGRRASRASSLGGSGPAAASIATGTAAEEGGQIHGGYAAEARVSGAGPCGLGARDIWRRKRFSRRIRVGTEDRVVCPLFWPPGAGAAAPDDCSASHGAGAQEDSA
eukprot:scaffold5991_cov102-Isochrysis_galbana.AAC.3